MLRYLNGELNRRGRPNENYARELMELFCLGVADAVGNPNYTETDVRELARALSGWRSPGRPQQPAWRVQHLPLRCRLEDLPRPHRHLRRAPGRRRRTRASQHASYIVRKLWSDFIAGPPDSATLADLIATYTGNGMQLKPLLRKILNHSQLFDSLAEPTLIKPPIVYVAGGFRQGASTSRTRAPTTGSTRWGSSPLPTQRLRLGVRPCVPDDERRPQPVGFRLGSRPAHRGRADVGGRDPPGSLQPCARTGGNLARPGRERQCSTTPPARPRQQLEHASSDSASSWRWASRAPTPTSCDERGADDRHPRTETPPRSTPCAAPTALGPTAPI